MERTGILKLASWISIGGNTTLAFLKIVTGILTGSAAVLADGLDSLADVVISTVTLAASIIITQPPDHEHPYGHYRAETIATSILAFIIFFIGGQVCISTVEKLLYHEVIELPGLPALYATAISIAGKIMLSWSQFYFGRKTGSRMLAANGQNMLNDIIMSAGVLAGLGVGYFLDMPLVDKLLGMLIGIWIMGGAVRIFKGLVVELMEGHDDREPYHAIFDAVHEVSGAANPHRVRIRKVGAMYVIDLDVEVDGGMTVSDAHEIARRIESRIKEKLDNVFDIVIHTEPLGNVEKGEGYGLKYGDVPGRKY